MKMTQKNRIPLLQVVELKKLNIAQKGLDNLEAQNEIKI
jgi:hypothetical protein